MADFIPKQDNPLYVWLEKLKAGLPDYAADFELTPARTAKVNGWIDDHLAALKLVRQKRDEWLAASSQKKLQARKSLAGLRKEIARWKTAPGAANGGLAALNLTASLPALDADNLKPELVASLYGGQIRIRFKKRGATSVNIYVRHVGEIKGRLVAHVAKSPYLDPTPVAVPGTAETRTYYALGVKHDQETGQPSDSVSVALPG
jgi:hypothetical protein